MGVPIRVTLPAGLATVIGALPHLNPFDASRVVRELLPGLPAGPTIDLRFTEGDVDAAADGSSVASLDDDRLAAVRSFLGELRGRVEPVVLSLTGPVTIDLGLMQRGTRTRAFRAPHCVRRLRTGCRG